MVRLTIREIGNAGLGYVATAASCATTVVGNLGYYGGKTASCALGVVALVNLQECVQSVFEGMPDVAGYSLGGRDVIAIVQDYLPDHAVTYLSLATAAAIASAAVNKAGRQFNKICVAMSARAVQLPTDHDKDI